MRGKSFIQWGLLLCIAAMLILFEAIHLHVGWYNLFLVLLISSAFVVILCTRMVERRGSWRSEDEG
jgi:membrane protein implicated in regulation of membrane protease activity